MKVLPRHGREENPNLPENKSGPSASRGGPAAVTPKPTSSSAALFVLQFLERLARRPEAVNARRNPAIDRDLKKYLLDLILGETVFQRGLDMQLQLMRPIERGDHR